MQATLELLSEFDAELAASVRGVMQMPRQEYREMLKAGGYAEDLSRGSYMRWQIKKELITQVDWQFEALSQVRQHSSAFPHLQICGAHQVTMLFNGRTACPITLYWQFAGMRSSSENQAM